MIRTALSLLLMALAGVAAAKSQVQTANGDGAQLRMLDLVTGRSSVLTFAIGETRVEERLEITLTECRYPAENPAGDAFAQMTIRDVRQETPNFEGWMIASSPALYALEHPRYDVWVLSCTISEPVTEDG